MRGQRLFFCAAAMIASVGLAPMGHAGANSSTTTQGTANTNAGTTKAAPASQPHTSAARATAMPNTVFSNSGVAGSTPKTAYPTIPYQAPKPATLPLQNQQAKPGTGRTTSAVTAPKS